MTTDLKADCARCVGLCCVALPFTRSADFPIDKPAAQPCLHLQKNDRCGIHTDLRARGFNGCVTFDCFGAGQHVTQATFAGADWRSDAAGAAQMFATFAVMRQLHEMLWYLDQAHTYARPGALRDDIDRARADTDELTRQPAKLLTAFDVATYRAGIGELLAQVSSAKRASDTTAERLRGVDLVGADLTRRDLRGADLRGSLLIAAKLGNVDLSNADLLGADLRDADLRGARLDTALFVTQPQVNSANGDARTRIPRSIDRPAHWQGATA